MDASYTFILQAEVSGRNPTGHVKLKPALTGPPGKDVLPPGDLVPRYEESRREQHAELCCGILKSRSILLKASSQQHWTSFTGYCSTVFIQLNAGQSHGGLVASCLWSRTSKARHMFRVVTDSVNYWLHCVRCKRHTWEATKTSTSWPFTAKVGPVESMSWAKCSPASGKRALAFSDKATNTMHSPLQTGKSPGVSAFGSINFFPMSMGGGLNCTRCLPLCS
eukprot:6475473-Amphidinium_carterae.1